jgi:hypothetical protein
MTRATGNFNDDYADSLSLVLARTQPGEIGFTGFSYTDYPVLRLAVRNHRQAPASIFIFPPA